MKLNKLIYGVLTIFAFFFLCGPDGIFGIQSL